MCLVKTCECCSLDWVFAHDAIYFLHVTCLCITMHWSFLFFPSWASLPIVFSFTLSLSFLLWHPRNPFLRRNWYLVMVLPLLFLFLLEIGSVIQNPKRILRRISTLGWFTWNTKSFYLTFQTLLYPMRLALEVGNLSTRNPLDVLACLYRSFTPTYMSLIPLFLSLLRYFEEHIS